MLVMRCLVSVTVLLSLLSGWSRAQAPGDAQSFCTETLPSNGVNILDYPPEVKPLISLPHDVSTPRSKGESLIKKRRPSPTKQLLAPTMK